MKSKILLFGFVVISIVSYYSFIYLYPQSPIESISNVKILSSVVQSNKDVTYLGDEDKHRYYITKHDNGASTEKIINFMKNNGFTFQNQDGAGLFFVSGERDAIVTTQMWSKKYVIFKIPLSTFEDGE